MFEERREAARVAVSLMANWTGDTGSHAARVRDLSAGGCSLETAGRARPGEVIVLELQTVEGERLNLSARVIYIIAGTGFGLFFVGLSDAARAALARLIVSYRE